MPQHTTEATVVYTLNDLESWSYDGTSLAVLGHPIEHSISPPMQNAALAEMTRRDTRFANWRYFKFDITAGDLPKALSFLHAKKFLGLNLTVPHKVQVVDLVDTIDPTAQRMGAVNTLNWKPGGYHGCNTDGFGFEKALLEDLKAEITGSDIILLGAGGAARAIAAQCLHSGCRTLWIGNRNPERLRSLIEISLMEILGKSESPNCVRGFDLLDIPDDLPTTGILINATSLGLKTDDPAPLTLDQFDNKGKDHLHPKKVPLK